jgi:hypothetical protein
MQREVLKFLYDVDQACALIVRFTSGKTFDEYIADDLLSSAVERQFIIVGEALLQGAAPGAVFGIFGQPCAPHRQLSQRDRPWVFAGEDGNRLGHH